MSPGPGSVATSKFPNGVSQAEERLAQRKTLRAQEKAVKDAVRKRDGRGCRWPYCPFWKEGVTVDGAHIEPKGSGGDHGLRTTEENMLRLCRLHHKGSRSVHSGDLRIVPLTRQGAKGPVRFEQKDGRHWIIVGVERAIGVLV